MEPVSKEMCDVKCGNFEKDINTLNGRVGKQGEQIDEVSRNLAMASAILDSCARRLDDSEKRIKALESKPQKRFDQIITVVSQWAILLVLGIMAAKLGL